MRQSGNSLRCPRSSSMQGSMAAPFYNTRSTKLSMVVNGEGYFEMACPHVSGEGEERREREEEEGERREGQGRQRQVHYQKMRSRLSCGTAFLVPAGHPVSIVASGNQNLQLICFEINARDNRRLFLAGNNPYPRTSPPSSQTSVNPKFWWALYREEQHTEAAGEGGEGALLQRAGEGGGGVPRPPGGDGVRGRAGAPEGAPARGEASPAGLHPRFCWVLRRRGRTRAACETCVSKVEKKKGRGAMSFEDKGLLCIHSSE